MKNHRFPWLRNRTTDNRKCEKARNIKEKRTIEMFNTVSRPPVALRSSASDNLQLKNAKKARKYAIFRAFSIPKILPGLFGFDGIEREFMGLSWSNYWWTIGANEVQFCHRRTNTYLTDLHRALAHSLKTRMGRGSFFRPKSGETNLSRR